MRLDTTSTRRKDWPRVANTLTTLVKFCGKRMAFEVFYQTQIVYGLRNSVTIARCKAVVDTTIDKVRVPAVWVFVSCPVESHCLWWSRSRSRSCVYASENSIFWAAVTWSFQCATTGRELSLVKRRARRELIWALVWLPACKVPC
jgi:hypothetical protein